MIKKKIICMMPIKMNNERCPGKNTRMLGDKPLLQWELDSVIATGLCESVYVYCSTSEITAFLPDNATFVKRPAFLDLPTSNFTQIFSCFREQFDADIYVYIHATAPFISIDTMKECIEAVVSGKYDSAFCARELQDFLWIDGKPLNFDAANLPRTQDLKKIYQETSGIYVFTKEVFDKYNRRIGAKPFIKEVSIKESVDIDSLEDFAFAEAIIKASI